MKNYKMKKNIYKCQSCHHETKTADREEGTTPFMIACTKEGCEGMSYSSMYKVDQDIAPDYIFIKPSNEKEWEAVREDVKKDLEKEYPGLKKRKFMNLFYTVMKSVNEHISMGGLVHLPANTVNEMNSFAMFHTSIWNDKDVSDDNREFCIKGIKTDDFEWLIHNGYFVKTNLPSDALIEKFDEFVKVVYPVNEMEVVLDEEKILKKTKIFKVEFKDKTEWIQATNKDHLMYDYREEYGDEVDDITVVTEIDEESAKTIMLKSDEPELADEWSLLDAVIDDGTFQIVGSTEWC